MGKLKITVIVIILLVAVAISITMFNRTTDQPRQLNLFIWSEYIDPDIVADFEKAFNVKVRIDLYESNEEMISMLQTGRQGAYDIIVPTTYFIPTLINLDLIEPLNRQLIPNVKNIDPRFTTIEEDPGNVYSIPYQWGTSGLVIRSDNPDEIEPSWKLLFEPDAIKGNFLIFDTARDAIGSALKYLGYSSNTTDLKQLEEATNLLIETKNRPTFMGFNGGVDGLSKVVGGVATLAQVYSGEAVKASLEDPDVHYIIPKEGGELWVDLFAIPKGAENADVAHQFLNWTLNPDVSARLANYSLYGSPVPEALAFISDEIKQNPGIYPPEEILNNMEYYKDLGNNSGLYEEAWTIVKNR
ncbi:MAG: spermidine/putrescine ABC transporter substrate-binding protein [Deltaproteobacteria bacterium]|jgi:spermidine/putrescine transport system substrate-binding protein|nr:spermidine/putrescine ABC transporter substrate-binding protein [Deltaproteobacteria bacterium]